MHNQQLRNEDDLCGEPFSSSEETVDLYFTIHCENLLGNSTTNALCCFHLLCGAP